MAVVLDTGAVSRGSGSAGSNRERDIRKRFVEAGPDRGGGPFAGEPLLQHAAPAIVMVINRAKHHAGEILFINASKQFEKGRPKNRLADDHVELLARAHEVSGQPPRDLSAIVCNVGGDPKRLQPVSESVRRRGRIDEDVMPLEDAVVLFREAEAERTKADAEL